jgi:hypothetical protein
MEAIGSNPLPHAHDSPERTLAELERLRDESRRELERAQAQLRRLDEMIRAVRDGVRGASRSSSA